MCFDLFIKWPTGRVAPDVSSQRHRLNDVREASGGSHEEGEGGDGGFGVREAGPLAHRLAVSLTNDNTTTVSHLTPSPPSLHLHTAWQ